MPNMAKLLSSHNRKVLEEHISPVTNVATAAERKCSCRNIDNCPLSGECLSKNIVYQAIVTTGVNGINKDFKYVGLTSTTFKERLANHRADAKHISKRKNTSLSEFVWALKDKKAEYEIKWKLLQKAPHFCIGSRKCQLCVMEKFYIIFRPLEADINKRNELPTSCRHRKKYLLCP